MACVLGAVMLRSFELSRHRRINLWLGEPPPAVFTPSVVVTHVVKPKVVLNASQTIAGIEINIPHGPKASYALLGAELVALNTDGLEVVVSVNNAGMPLLGAIALKPDDVRVGLLDEYARAVVAGVANAAESNGVPTSASLRFRWAAHGLVGSSPSVFEKVSELIVRVLTLPASASDEQVVALFG
jgi:hypothetical protein